MKKTFKRLGAALLAMAMAVSVLCTGALAAETSTTYTLTINDTNSKHKYVAYQVFKGDAYPNNTSDTNKTLSNIVWGTGVDQTTKKDDKGNADNTNGKTLLEAIQAIQIGENKDKPFANKTTAAEIAEVLGSTTNNAKDSDVAKKFAAVVANYVTGDGHSSGQFVEASGDGESAVAAHYTISGLTAGYYFVKSNNDTGATDVANTRYILSVVGDSTVDTKSAVPTVDKKVKNSTDTEDKETTTAQIGEKVTFTLTGTLPNNYNEYETYKYVFHDTLSNGLTLDKDSIKVYKNSVDKSNLISNNASNTYYTIKPTGNDTTLDDGCTFEVEFTNLKTVTTTQTDTILVQYTATLNKNAAVAGNDNKVKLEYSNDPNKEGTGTTTEKEVKVYTFQMNVEKVAKDNANLKLKDAMFVLSTSDSLMNDNGVLKDAILDENSTLTDEQKKALIAVTGTAPNYTVADNNTDTNNKYVMKTADGDNLGQLNIKGLKPGAYYLYETKAPEGYNKLTKPIKIEIKVTTNGTLTKLPTLETTVDDSSTKITTTNGTIETVQVVNNAGSQLPSTGGMGTTLFYIIGGVLMAGAAVVLVIKKKRSSAE